LLKKDMAMRGKTRILRFRVVQERVTFCGERGDQKRKSLEEKGKKLIGFDQKRRGGRQEMPAEEIPLPRPVFQPTVEPNAKKEGDLSDKTATKRTISKIQRRERSVRERR